MLTIKIRLYLICCNLILKNPKFVGKQIFCVLCFQQWLPWEISNPVTTVFLIFQVIPPNVIWESQYCWSALPLYPTFLGPTCPVSLKVSRRHHILSLLRRFLPDKSLFECQWVRTTDLFVIYASKIFTLSSLAYRVVRFSEALGWKSRVSFTICLKIRRYCKTRKNLIRLKKILFCSHYTIVSGETSTNRGYMFTDLSQASTFQLH